jgi:hypothetical protein
MFEHTNQHNNNDNNDINTTRVGKIDASSAGRAFSYEGKVYSFRNPMPAPATIPTTTTTTTTTTTGAV